jgi:RNA recognition motif-containing protein
MRSSNGASKLFVGDIGDNRKSDISRIFSKYGEISTIYVDDNKHFAFVEFTSSSDAQRALEHTQNKTVNGARLRVEYAKADKPSRDNRRPLSREHSPASTLYNHLQITANRLPSMQSIRQSYYQHHPSTMMTNSAMSRGRSLTPPSLKQNARLSSMNHLRTQDFYPPYYPHPAVYADSAYYRAYGDPYLMQRLPPPTFLPSASPPPPPPSSSRAYRNMYSSSSGFDRYPSVMSHRRPQRSRSRSRRRSSPSRRNRSSRERKRKRRTPSNSSPQQQRERGPQTPPPSHRPKKRSRSTSNTVVSTSERKSSSPSSSEDEGKGSNSKRSQDNDSNRKHSKRRTKE